MTPWQTIIIADELGDRQEAKGTLAMAAAWHTAAFHRAKRMPPLKKVLNPEGKVRSRDDLVAQLKTQFGGFPGVKNNG